MAHRAWTAAVFRILAVWRGANLVTALPGTLGAFQAMLGRESGQSFSLPVVPVAASFIVSAIMVWLFWSWSGRLADWVWRGWPVPSESPDLQPAALQQAVLAGFGIYLLVSALPSLAELAAGYYTLSTGFGSETNYADNLKGRTIGVGLQMVAGVLLVAAAKPAAQWLSRPAVAPEGGEDEEA
jgi:hypothetical protein